MIPARRRCLAGLCLGLLAGSGFGRAAAPAAETGVAKVLRRWPTGNAELAPPTRAGARVLFAGEHTIGLIEPTAARPLWTHSHRLPAGAVFRPRTVDGIVVCGGLAEIGAWRLADGKPLWRYRTETQLGVPCLHDGRVYCGDGHHLVALDLASGKIPWRFAAVADTQISYAPTAVGDTVLVGPGDGRLYALATPDGRPRWTVNGIETWQYLRQLHVSGKLLVAGSYTEKLLGIDIATGKTLWEFNAGNFINSHHVANGVAYLWSPTGWLYAIDAHTGAVRWRHNTTDYRGGGRWAALYAELTTQGERLYALDLTPELHVLDIRTGNEIARLALPEPVHAFVLPLSPRHLLFGAESGDLLLTAAATNARR